MWMHPSRHLLLQYLHLLIIYVGANIYGLMIDLKFTCIIT